MDYRNNAAGNQGPSGPGHQGESFVKKGIIAAAAAIMFVSGIGVGYSAKPSLAPALYHGETDQEAARGLLGLALKQAEDGSWEQIGVGRVYYLGGFKAEGQAIFDKVLGGKHDDGDVYRVARVYREAGEKEKASAMFERYLAGNPDDARALSEVGAYTLLDGNHEAAERLFDRSFAAEHDDMWATLQAAGAYLGVAPQP